MDVFIGLISGSEWWLSVESMFIHGLSVLPLMILAIIMTYSCFRGIKEGCINVKNITLTLVKTTKKSKFIIDSTMNSFMGLC